MSRPRFGNRRTVRHMRTGTWKDRSPFEYRRADVQKTSQVPSLETTLPPTHPAPSYLLLKRPLSPTTPLPSFRLGTIRVLPMAAWRK